MNNKQHPLKRIWNTAKCRWVCSVVLTIHEEVFGLLQQGGEAELAPAQVCYREHKCQAPY